MNHLDEEFCEYKTCPDWKRCAKRIKFGMLDLCSRDYEDAGKQRKTKGKGEKDDSSR